VQALRRKVERLKEAMHYIVAEADLENADLNNPSPIETKTGWDCWIATARSVLSKEGE